MPIIVCTPNFSLVLHTVMEIYCPKQGKLLFEHLYVSGIDYVSVPRMGRRAYEEPLPSDISLSRRNANIMIARHVKHANMKN